MAGRRLIAAAGVALVLAMLAQAGSADGTATPKPTCDPARAHAPGDETRTMQSGGRTREFIVHVPPSYTGSEPTPVVVLLHGLGLPAAVQLQYSQTGAKADAAGFILVVPQGLGSPVLPQAHWNYLVLEPGAPDDVAFIGDLLDLVEQELCTDPSRVYSAGLSNGAMMSVRLACDLSERIAAIAAVAGVYYPPWSADLATEPGCAPERPVPIVAIHGTADEIIPYSGGPTGLTVPFRTRNIETEVMPLWAAANGCAPAPASTQVTEHVRRVSYTGCAADTELYAIDGGRHVWPGAQDSPAPDPADEVSANDIVWDFFQSRALDRGAVATPSRVGLPSMGSGGGERAGFPWWALALASGAAGAGVWLVRRRALRR